MVYDSVVKSSHTNHWFSCFPTKMEATASQFKPITLRNGTFYRAEAIIPKLSSGGCKEDAEPSVFITCDQVVVYEGMIREKASSEEEVRQFIKGYSGRSTATVSSVLVTNLKTGVRKGDWDRVEMNFHAIPDEIVDNLIEEGIVLHLAGGLIIEHPLILLYVEQVVGTTDRVMGLPPKALTERLIKEALLV